MLAINPMNFSQDDINLILSEFSEPQWGIVMFITCLDKVMLTSRATRQDDVINYQSCSCTNRLNTSAGMLSTPLMCGGVQ